jgi:hypothetical protein
MNKISISVLLVIVLSLLGLPGGSVNTVAASTPPRGSVDGLASIGLKAALDGRSRHYPYDPPRAQPVPQVTELQTVPAVPGVTFQIAGQQFVTGADGTTVVMVPQPGTYDLQVITDTYHDPYRRVEFSRWLSESYQPTRQIHLPTTTPVVQVGLDTFELVGEKFVGLDGLPVNPQRVTSFSIRSLQGDTFTFKDGQPRWIPASRITRRRVGGLEEVRLLYTVTQVMVDGSNVVNKSQQQFYAQPNAAWSISLLLYALHIQATDAMFGFPQGKALELQLPDGRTQTYPLDSAGSAQMYSLARGNYYFRVLGAKGLSTRAPIALSKDQSLTTRVISYLDLGVVAGAGVLLALALLLYGRFAATRRSARTEERRGRIHLTEP